MQNALEKLFCAFLAIIFWTSDGMQKYFSLWNINDVRQNELLIHK